MKNATLAWFDPVTRLNGVALPPGEIAFIDIQLSADQGKNFASVAHVKAGVQQFVQTALDPGTYMFRVLVNTVDGLVSGGVGGSVTVPVPVPVPVPLPVAPSDVTGLTITLS